ncbi:MAG: hypothetical protein ACREGR_01600 [Minisyncoccia bacterium]
MEPTLRLAPISALPAPPILKADGSVEAFSAERLVSSLMRAGAPAHAAQEIAERIARSLLPNTTSKEIYRKAFTLLRKEARPLAARYGLRRALLELGPTGHPFEDFISHLYQREGWSVETRKIIQGKCVAHETDFYASRAGEFMAAELKYHNDPGYKSDLKTALYVKSRFDDIFACDPNTRACPIDRGILITNTKFTSEAVKYAQCAGVELLGWSYPAGADLFERMSAAHTYPVTALTTLEGREKRLLISEGVIAVDQLPERKETLRALHIEPERIGRIIAEAEALHAV